MIVNRKESTQVWWPLLSFLLVAFVGMICSGCGSDLPKIVPVIGKITYNGQPLTSGIVMLIPEDSGHAATGAIQPDGSFKLTSFKLDDGAAPGTYKVTVQIFSNEAAGGESIGLPGTEFDAGKKSPIPLSYGNPSATTLRAVINDGKTELTLELKD